jgi:methylmalonyl-CoA mutase
MPNTTPNKIRIVTAAALFDGHDAAINIMRRILQAKGAEVIHLGHNRSVREIVECAIEEDVQGIAITSYQGGHVEFFKYMKDLLVESCCGTHKNFWWRRRDHFTPGDRRAPQLWYYKNLFT